MTRKLELMTKDLLLTLFLIVIAVYIVPVAGVVNPLTSQIAAFFAGKTAMKFVENEYDVSEEGLTASINNGKKTIKYEAILTNQ
ncbi:MAG: hypothetical protein ACRCXZ_02115 [Patescibacteria group bacterium]